MYQRRMTMLHKEQITVNTARNSAGVQNVGSLTGQNIF